MNLEDSLTRRERQIMRIIYRRGSASVTAIAAETTNPPSNTALRTHLSILEKKGHLTRKREGRKNIYFPIVSRRKAAAPILRDVVDSFFGGSLADAVAAHLANPDIRLDEDEVTRLEELIRRAGELNRDD